MRVEQVKPNLYVIRGPFDPCAPGGCTGRNADDGLLHEPGDVAVRVTPEGAIVVDDKFVQNVPDVMAKVKSITSQPIKYLLNSHHHADHIGGNGAVMDLGISATLRVVGIGTMEADASILSTGMIERDEFEEARRAGGAGEILGHIFSLTGKRIENDLSARALSMSAADIGRQKTVAIAGGRSKIDPIKAILASGLVFGLITDERTANALTA